MNVVGLSTAPGAVTILADKFHSCALLTAGSVKCWGLNDLGQLGDGTTTSASDTPMAVLGLSGVSAITAGNAHSCALLADGTVECWGANTYGELGNGTNVNATTPVPVTGLTENGFGQLGNGTQVDSTTPVPVSGLSGASPPEAAPRVSPARIGCSRHFTQERRPGPSDRPERTSRDLYEVRSLET